MNKTALTLVSLLVFAMPTAAQDMSATIENCNGCHGDGGVSQWSDVPTIAGIDAFSHSEALFVYRDAARPCEDTEYRAGDTSRAPTSMCEVASALSDDQIDALAEHYSMLPFVPAKQSFDAALAATGAGIHESECDRCHSDGGSNAEDEASILAGQWMGYLESTFAEYAAGEREQPKQMQEKLGPLSGDDVKALLHFYASQQ